MRKIEAIIKPFQLDEVKSALDRIAVAGLTVTETKGFVGQNGWSEFHRGAEYDVGFVPKVKIEVLVDEAKYEAVVDAIADVGRTGRNCDGQIAVSPVDDAVRIRTGERGANAI